MTKPFKIFAIDDDQFTLDITHALLAEFFEVETFLDASDFLNRVHCDQPDMVLLDYQMPDMDGLAVCKILQENPQTAGIPIVFVSATDDIDIRLSCYQAGACDFIQKPFDPRELQIKAELTRARLNERQEESDEISLATSTALNALSSLGEQGTLLRAIAASYHYRSPIDLARGLVSTLRDMGLEGAVQILDPNPAQQASLVLSQNGLNLPLETSILNHARKGDRIFQFKSRCAFNGEKITILVNNMPLDDPQRAGRIRDHLLLLTDSADACLATIHRERQLLENQQKASIAIDHVQGMFRLLEQTQRQHNLRLIEATLGYQEALNRSFSQMGLSQGQEDRLTRLASEHMEHILATHGDIPIGNSLHQLCRLLSNITQDFENAQSTTGAFPAH